MLQILQILTLLFAFTGLQGTAFAKSPAEEKAPEATAETTGRAPAVLWREPKDVASRDLFYGPGGRNHAPPSKKFTFVKEDAAGSNPKFVVRDDNGVRWKIKLGSEAKPEVAATRLVWAVGYFSDEDYFLPDIRISEMPEHLHRGHKLFSDDGTARDVRLKREEKGDENEGTWKWKHDPFTGQREWNGLRTLMAVINNWDLKDENNKILIESGERIYEVSDLGASFGANGIIKGHDKSRGKGELEEYIHSKFITKEKSQTVDFATPGRPTFLALGNPRQYFARLHLRWIGRNVRRSDAKWMGSMLARLSPKQVRDAFRSAGYSEAEVEGFAQVFETRVAALNDL
jgi:hypothetical protein